MSDLETFRAETRAWLEANCPAEVRGPPASEDDSIWGGRRAVFKTPGHRLWLERMAERGWTAPEWPREYGGGGLSRDCCRAWAGPHRKARPEAPPRPLTSKALQAALKTSDSPGAPSCVRIAP